MHDASSDRHHHTLKKTCTSCVLKTSVAKIINKLTDIPPEQSLSPEPTRSTTNHSLKFHQISTRTDCFKTSLNLKHKRNEDVLKKKKKKKKKNGSVYWAAARYVKVGNLLLSAINCFDTVHIQSNRTTGDRALSKLERAIERCRN